jgi:hypothetical protein
MMWTDELWDEVWEGTLDSVERQRIARATWARELPDDPLHRRMVPELARRWSRSARNHILFHLLWVVFWGAIARAADPVDGQAVALASAMALFSGVVIVLCVAVRRYLQPVTLFG